MSYGGGISTAAVAFVCLIDAYRPRISLAILVTSVVVSAM